MSGFKSSRKNSGGGGDNYTENVAVKVVSWNLKNGVGKPDPEDTFTGELLAPALGKQAGEEVTVKLRRDKGAENRKFKRPDIADLPYGKKKVQPGATVAVERTFVDPDGNLNANWIKPLTYNPMPEKPEDMEEFSFVDAMIRVDPIFQPKDQNGNPKKRDDGSEVPKQQRVSVAFPEKSKVFQTVDEMKDEAVSIMSIRGAGALGFVIRGIIEEEAETTSFQWTHGNPEGSAEDALETFLESKAGKAFLEDFEGAEGAQWEILPMLQFRVGSQTMDGTDLSRAFRTAENRDRAGFTRANLALACIKRDDEGKDPFWFVTYAVPTQNKGKVVYDRHDMPTPHMSDAVRQSVEQKIQQDIENLRAKRSEGQQAQQGNGASEENDAEAEAVAAMSPSR